MSKSVPRRAAVLDSVQRPKYTEYVVRGIRYPTGVLRTTYYVLRTTYNGLMATYWPRRPGLYHGCRVQYGAGPDKDRCSTVPAMIQSAWRSSPITGVHPHRGTTRSRHRGTPDTVHPPRYTEVHPWYTRRRTPPVGHCATPYSLVSLGLNWPKGLIIAL